jgi:hypothetical protein
MVRRTRILVGHQMTYTAVLMIGFKLHLHWSQLSCPLCTVYLYYRNIALSRHGIDTVEDRVFSSYVWQCRVSFKLNVTIPSNAFYNIFTFLVAERHGELVL